MEEISKCLQKTVKFEWVKGHAGNEMNERADILATKALTKEILKEDTGYTPELSQDDLFSE